MMENGKWQMANGKTVRWLVLFSIFHFPFSMLAGCASDKQSNPAATSASDHQEAAVKDPFGYKPNMDETDISAGGINNYDRKAMKKDIDDVLNP